MLCQAFTSSRQLALAPRQLSLPQPAARVPWSCWGLLASAA